MITETGNRACSANELIEKVLNEKRDNNNVLKKFLEGTRIGNIVRLDCNYSCADRYEVIGRIRCKFAPSDCDIPEGVSIRRDRGLEDEFVHYSHIRSFSVLSGK